MTQWINKYKHAWVFLYFIPYLIWFQKLEKTITTEYTIIQTKLDHYILFNEWFIIPYLLWFLYIAVVVFYFFFTSKEDFYRLCSFLFIGMTICLTIYTLWPNGQNLRPDITTLGRDTILTRLVAYIYSMDTSTNVFPSIHVFNSIGVYIAIYKNETLRQNKWILWGTLFLTVLICLSTMFLKQHSALDSIGAIILCVVMHYFVYGIREHKKTKENAAIQTY